MPPTRKGQKKRGGKKPRVPPPSTSLALQMPLEAFFADYAPQFQYDATVSASLEFYRLCNESSWKKDDPQRQVAHQNFKDALVKQFNLVYGTDVNDFGAWQNLCYVVGIDPIPDDLHACRETVYYTFVNLVDLVDTKTTEKKVEVFPSECALSEYTRTTGKFFPSDSALAGGVLRYLLRHILHPRDGYDTSRTWSKSKLARRR